MRGERLEELEWRQAPSESRTTMSGKMAEATGRCPISNQQS